MRVVLEVAAGPARGQRIRLHDGLVARFGQTEWADFSFPDDSAMAEFHFLLDCRQQQCVLHAMGTAETFVNAAEVRQQMLCSGDRVLAGETEFVVHVDGMVQPAGEGIRQRPSDRVAAAAAALSASEICQRLELAGKAPALAATSADARELSEHLATGGDYHQALRVRAFTLGQRPAVAWGCHVVQETCGEDLNRHQIEGLKAALEWVKTGEQSASRNAETAALNANYQGPGGLLAAAAFWSGDNLAPLSSPQPVAPDDTLTSRGVAGALLLALHHPSQTPISENYQRFASTADRIQSGELVVFPA